MSAKLIAADPEFVDKDNVAGDTTHQTAPTPVVTYEVKNARAYGKLNIQKLIAEQTADLDLTPKDLSGVEFELRATQDIINPDDGTVLTAKGGLAKNIYGNEIGAFHGDIITDGIEADLKFTEKMLKISIASLNKAGNELTELMMNNINEMAMKPVYQSIETSKMLLSAEAGNGVILKFPSTDKEKALTIWHPKDYIGPTQDQTGIILRFYPDWKFHEICP